MKDSDIVRCNKSTKTKKKYEVDMCNGPLLGKIIVFAIPLMLSSALQLAFNAADMIVVGRFTGSEALAAVGSTGSLNNLIINFFIGLSVGTNVMVARYFGSGQKEKLKSIVHTAIMTALVCGLFLSVFGIGIARYALGAMGTPDNVIDQSVLYMRIYFLSMPFLLVYNFGSAILRAIGDTKRPLYYLFIAGTVNVVLNLILVTVFSMGVAGVAIATVASHVISSSLVVRSLMRSEGAYQLEISELRIIPGDLLEILKIGFPAGLQSILFGISNVMIQSSVNSFGAIAMAGNTASQNIEGFIGMAMGAFYQASLSFTGQNFGARKMKRIGRICIICECLAFSAGVLVGGAALLFSNKLLGLYTTDPAVIEYGMLRLSIMASFYFLAGMMDVIVGMMRGMGHSMVPMFVTMTGACLFRIVWLHTVFVWYRTPNCLYTSYPISWALTGSVQLICFLVVYRKMYKMYGSGEVVEAA